MSKTSTRIACAAFAIVGTVWVASPNAASNFHNPSPITIGNGSAIPYPTTITVSGLVGTIKDVGVTLRNYSHDNPDDVDVLLVGPGGQSLIIMSDVGGSNGVNNVTIGLTDRAVSPMPDASQITGSSYKPTNVGTGDVFPPPAPDPVPSSGTFVGTFGGTNPNGTWSLYVVDDSIVNDGQMAGGWSIGFVLDAPSDYDGDAKTDYVVVRNTGGGPSGEMTWFMLNAQGFSARPFGIASDTVISSDYDGDTKTDITVWRPGAQGVFYRLNSTNGAFMFQPFGQTGDDPRVVGDYDGDGLSDVAVYRAGSAGGPSFWYALRSTNGTLITQQWGQGGDAPAPGDYDGDRRADFAVRRDVGGSGVFFVNTTSNGAATIYWGLPTDKIVPGDYDGDGKTDVAVTRNVSGALHWYIQQSSNGGFLSFVFGLATDSSCQGDYDGDGKTDVAVWRASATPGQTAFYVLKSNAGGLPNQPGAQQWGQLGDYPVANSNTH